MNMSRCVVVGTGDWARAHLSAWQECPCAEIVGICDPVNEDQAKALAKELDIPNASADLDSLITQTQPVLIDVPCNPHYRLEPVKIAAKHECVTLVNLEKPIALTPSDAYEIERIGKDRDLKITVNHQKRFLPAWRKAKKAIDTGKIGDVKFLRASCKGNILEQGTHLVDMVLHFMNYQPVSWVIGQVAELQGFDKPQASAPDAAVATIEFTNGNRAYLTFGSVGHDVIAETFKWYHFTCEVYGSNGEIQVSLNQNLRIRTYDDTLNVEEPSSWDDHYIEALAMHFRAAVNWAGDPNSGHPSSLNRAMMGFEVIMAIYESAYAHRQVNLPFRAEDNIIESLKEWKVGEKA